MLTEAIRAQYTARAESYTQARAILDGADQSKPLDAETQARYDALMADYDARCETIKRLEQSHAAERDLAAAIPAVEAAIHGHGRR